MCGVLFLSIKLVLYLSLQFLPFLQMILSKVAPVNIFTIFIKILTLIWEDFLRGSFSGAGDFLSSPPAPTLPV